ncbi:MAG: ABC transporter permease [Gemmatimonadetes bacterium]|nr:ABC transporter permease [Gemmatimonadota bacterium]
MNRTITIAKKEFTDVLRDKRTILMMIVMPLLAIPLLMTIVIKVVQRQERKADEEQIDLAVVGAGYAPRFFETLQADSQFVIREDVREADFESLIREDSLDAGIVIPPDFQDRIGADEQASIALYYRSSSSFKVAEQRLRGAVDSYDEEIVDGRIRRLSLDPNLFDAIAIEARDISTMQEVLGKTVGGFLPYMFVIFMFTGAMYAGIDLSAGEKERGTLETLLSSPASRLEIVLGKFVVVATIGIASALISMLGLYLGVRGAIGEIPPEALDVVWDILSLKVVVMIATLLLPLAAFFSAMILALAIQAKSFKEAQSILTPFSIVIILPVAFGLLPGIELNAQTAMIPILNVSLATKEVIAGTINPVHLAISYVSLFALAAASLWFCVVWFNREETLFRN